MSPHTMTNTMEMAGNGGLDADGGMSNGIVQKDAFAHQASYG